MLLAGPQLTTAPALHPSVSEGIDPAAPQLGSPLTAASEAPGPVPSSPVEEGPVVHADMVDAAADTVAEAFVSQPGAAAATAVSLPVIDVPVSSDDHTGQCCDISLLSDPSVCCILIFLALASISCALNPGHASKLCQGIIHKGHSKTSSADVCCHFACSIAQHCLHFKSLCR